MQSFPSDLNTLTCYLCIYGKCYELPLTNDGWLLLNHEAQILETTWLTSSVIVKIGNLNHYWPMLRAMLIGQSESAVSILREEHRKYMLENCPSGLDSDRDSASTE